MADNLSMALQGSTVHVSASEGQTLLQMTITALESIQSDECFSLLWKLVELKRHESGVDNAKLPRQKKVPRRLEVGTSVPTGHTFVEDKYRQMYYEIIDHVVQAIRDRFDQRGYKMFCRLETLLFTAEVDKDKFADVFTFYGGNLNAESLVTQLHVLHSNLPAEVEMRKVG